MVFTGLDILTWKPDGSDLRNIVNILSPIDTASATFTAGGATFPLTILYRTLSSPWPSSGWKGPIWITKKLENLPKIKFCVCTIRPCLAVHVAPRDVHACSILSRILWFCDSTFIAIWLTKWHISLTNAMLFPPVGPTWWLLYYFQCGEWVLMWYERNVMYSVCTLLKVVIWVFLPCHWWVSKKKIFAREIPRGV